MQNFEDKVQGERVSDSTSIITKGGKIQRFLALTGHFLTPSFYYTATVDLTKMIRAMKGVNSYVVTDLN